MVKRFLISYQTFCRYSGHHSVNGPFIYRTHIHHLNTGCVRKPNAYCIMNLSMDVDKGLQKYYQPFCANQKGLNNKM